MTHGTGRRGGIGTRLALAVALVAVLVSGAAIAPARASGESLLLIEADTGKVLKAENATYPWYPASITKLMTAYLTLRAIKEGRLTLDTVLTVSPNAVAQPPTKMGFRSGTQLTVDNALKMMLVRSANDIAVVLAEGVAGSIERFADEMNATSRRLGMTQSSWVNPNGLPADNQITSARDMAILARRILLEFPEFNSYWDIQAIRLGKRVIRNTNALIIHYPGADGMKTGFICASGFNVVATATRGNRRLIAVVLGAPSSAVRSAKAAYMFETAFNNTGLSWLTPSLGRVEDLQPINAAPPNLRDEICGKRRRRPGAEAADDDEDDGAKGFISLFTPGPGPKPSSLISNTVELAPPVRVYVGPPRPSRDSAVANSEEPALATKHKRRAHKNGLVVLPGRAEGNGGSAPVPKKRPAAATKRTRAAATAKPRPRPAVPAATAVPEAKAKPKARVKPKASQSAATAKPPTQ
jgi:D-alanyl-D-alanine carboxypeptidase